MEERTKDTLSNVIADRLISNWQKCDVLPSGSARYNSLTDECSVLRNACRDYDIDLPESICQRF